MKNWIIKLISEKEKKPLTNQEMNKLVPMFVDDTSESDHKCGSCKFRVQEDGDIAKCTIVEGNISLGKGTCSYWAKGDSSTVEQIASKQMGYTLSGYVEAPDSNFKINCGSCKFITDGFCDLWYGTVKQNQCCSTYDNSEVKEPGK